MPKRNIVGDSDGLVQPTHDPYWDAPITRREVQGAVNDLAHNDSILAAQNDTTNIVLNFLCERLEVKREEIDTWVAAKKAEMEARKLALEQASNAQVTSEPTNS